MEHVEGGPLTRRCDELGLSIPRRLRLFQGACEAVEHAHRRGIVHRDLKPSNILLGGDDDAPAVKVIDFGLAKATERKLTDRSAFTQVGAFLGTPPYMAPEQADPNRTEIGPGADVYALGVVLYELVSGTLPFDLERLRQGPAEMARILREEEPRSLPSSWARAHLDAEEIARRRGTDPRSLRRLLRGELAWIVHKCLEKDPRKRYPSARALAADIERHLTHQPVEARRPGLTYRAAKWVRRNQTAAAAVAGALATLALAAGSLPLRRYTEAQARIEQVTTSGLVRGAGISPSGRYVLYHEGSRGSEPVLWLADRATGALERLPEVWRDAPDGTTLSPDETRVAGVRNDRQTAQSRLVVADARGGLGRTVATRSLDSPFQSPAWSPNGRTLAVTVGTNGFGGRPVGVVEVDVATGRERPIGPQDWLYALAKTWLPDGQALLLVGRRRDDAETTPSLYRLGRASGAIRRLRSLVCLRGGWYGDAYVVRGDW
jgi:hypothetical protein